MSKNTASHKNFLEVRVTVDGRIIEKFEIPTGHLKKMSMNTKVKGTDRLFLLSEEYSQVLEKYV